MTDKEKIRKEVQRLMGELIQKKKKGFGSDSDDTCILELQNVLTYIDSLQEEPVSIWHDPSKETPIQHSNILMIRKEEGSDFPPIAGCFNGTNSRLDGRNWSYYNGFCYNEIELPLKWAYVDDLLNLSNVGRTVMDWKEMPVSEELEQAAVEAFKQIVDSDKNNFLEIFKAGAEWQKQKDSMLVSEELEEAAKKYSDNENPICTCEECLLKSFKVGAKWGKNQAMAEIQAQSMALAHGCPEENTSNDLKKAADNALESITDQYDIISVGSCLEMFRLGAEWQKTQEYACYEEAFEDGAKWKVENLWKLADGDDLPEIDREVIALLVSGKVVFAHRPPEFWDGRDIETDKVTRYYPKTYDKGGWNIPDVKYWLDCSMPKEIEI